MRDLTSTLGSTSMQPIRPPQPASFPVKPLNQPTLSAMNGSSSTPRPSSTSSPSAGNSTSHLNAAPMSSMLQPMSANTKTRPMNHMSSTQSKQNMMSMNMTSPLTPMQPMRPINNSPSKTSNSFGGGSGVMSNPINTGWSIASPPQNTTYPSQSGNASSGWSFQTTSPSTAHSQQNWMSGNAGGSSSMNQQMPSMTSNMSWPNNRNLSNQPLNANSNKTQLSQSDLNDLLI